MSLFRISMQIVLSNIFWGKKMAIYEKKVELFFNKRGKKKTLKLRWIKMSPLAKAMPFFGSLCLHFN